jgi:hypothetical protein
MPNMTCYACGIKAQRREIRLAKKETRDPQITERCGSWKKGPCDYCNKKRIYITPISDFILIK